MPQLSTIPPKTLVNHFPQAPARNNQYWICIRGERERYESLVDAIMKDTEIEGGYVVEYDEYTEQGELYAGSQKEHPP